MSGFSSENTPLPTSIIGSNNTINETIIAQFFRPLSSNPGHKLTVNGTTQAYLPINAFNNKQSVLGFAEFVNGNEIKFKRGGIYTHTVFTNMFSTSPVNGMVAVDIIDKNGNSYAANVMNSKNINPSSDSAIIMTCILSHDVNDTCRLRFGGGEVPTIPTGLTILGNWLVQNYVLLDLVIWQVVDGGDGGFYKCILNTTANQNPGNSTYWLRIANTPGSNIELNITSILWRITLT